MSDVVDPLSGRSCFFFFQTLPLLASTPPKPQIKPVGGHILAHAVQTRMYLRKGSGEQRFAKVSQKRKNKAGEEKEEQKKQKQQQKPKCYLQLKRRGEAST